MLPSPDDYPVPDSNSFEDDAPSGDEFEPDDEIIAEVRAIRAAIWAEVGEDFDCLFERVLKVEAAERAAGAQPALRRGGVARAPAG